MLAAIISMFFNYSYADFSTLQAVDRNKTVWMKCNGNGHFRLRCSEGLIGRYKMSGKISVVGLRPGETRQEVFKNFDNNSSIKNLTMDMSMLALILDPMEVKRFCGSLRVGGGYQFLENPEEVCYTKVPTSDIQNYMKDREENFLAKKINDIGARLAGVASAQCKEAFRDESMQQYMREQIRRMIKEELAQNTSR